MTAGMNLGEVSVEQIEHGNDVMAGNILELLTQANRQEAQLLEAACRSAAKPALADIQGSDSVYLGALRGGGLLGVLNMGADDEPGHMSILSLAVRATCQRQGIARQLMLAALQRGAGAPFSVVTTSLNWPALALYRSLGFQVYRRGSLGPHHIEMVKLRLSASLPTASTLREFNQIKGQSSAL
jgi:ribosomal protein S18 acetylase RimI-like enzyme